MIDLYTSTTPNGRKISIALEEMGLPYTVRPVSLDNREQFKPEFVAISPNAKIPAIVDHDTGDSLFESGAILMYLGDKTGMFYPTEHKARILVHQWLMWQMANVGPMLGRAHYFLRYNAGKAPFAEEWFHGEAKRLYGVLDRLVENQDYMCGDYSIVDIATFPWIARHPFHKIDLDDYPNVRRWYLKIAARPAVQKGYKVPRDVSEIPMPD
jgi:GST-like protein